MEAEHPTSKLSSLNERCPEQKLLLLAAAGWRWQQQI